MSSDGARTAAVGVQYGLSGGKEAVAELRNGTRNCQCTSCDLFFSSVSAFDRHILGSGTASPRCASVTQMERMGLQCNGNGVWSVGKYKVSKREVA